MTEKPKPSRFTLNQKFTGIKSVVGSIFKFDSLFKVAAAGAIVGGGALAGDAASAWEIIPTPAAIEVIAVVEEGEDGFTFVPTSQVEPSILQKILTASENPVVVGDRDAEILANQNQILANQDQILARLVPPGPPLLTIVQENNCLLRSGKPCPQ